jgi:tRNA-2-methylthio-N6-dimethylallyladenosine synthase
MAGQVDEAVAAERLARLQDLLETQRRAFNAAQVGKTMDVLTEKPGRHPGQVIGRSPYLQAVHFEADAALIGQLTPLVIEGAGPNSLSGRSLALETA